MNRSAIVERLFRSLAGQTTGEPRSSPREGSGPLETQMRPIPSRRLKLTPLVGRVLDDDMPSTAVDGLALGDGAESSAPVPQPEQPELSQPWVEQESELLTLPQSPQQRDTPPAPSSAEPGSRLQPLAHKAEAETSRDSQSPQVTSNPSVRLNSSGQSSQVQPTKRPEAEKEPPLESSAASREKSEELPQTVEPTLQSELVPPPSVTIPPAPEPQQVLHTDKPVPLKVPTSKISPPRQAGELPSRQKFDMQPTELAENQQPAIVEIRPARSEPTTSPVQASTPKAPQEASAVPTWEPQNRALPPTPERQVPAHVTLAVPATDRMSERQAPQPASQRPSVSISIGRIEIVTRRLPSPRRRAARPREHQINPGLAFFQRR